ncbi:TetR/AcrR family transcriptional regulator [Parafrigoribacterium mesophilum]|uniref:TetR/AcrR family transcriptional regulator n=1 Tax=Parafrigoribacterium mesophilum TaxID=433646 RepID=UPI0031FC322C
MSAIFAATLAELDDHGYAALRMDAVAERAHLSKASLYRRWSGKLGLVVDAASASFPDSDQLADTGSLRGDLLANLRHIAALLAGATGEALRAVVADAVSDPDRAREVRGRTQGRSAQAIHAIVGRAIARGELPEIELTPRQAAVGHSMLRHHFLWHDELPDTLIVQIVDEVMLPLLVSVSGRPAPSAEAPS